METETPQPNREHIRLWVEALRSGEFEQGSDWLNSNGKMCCLGVACEVAIVNGLDLPREVREANWGQPEHVAYGDSSFRTGRTLPKEMKRWLGVDRHDPLVRTDRILHHDEWGTTPVGNMVKLSCCNDIYLLDFPTIATLIENTYLEEKGQ